MVKVIGGTVNKISGATGGLHCNVEHGMHKNEPF
jgi:hypothetical protein